MITGRFATPGKTRTCPHCRATILDSAAVCPGCQHHLRFDPSGAAQRMEPAATPLRVEGTIRHPSSGGAWEYSVVLAICNERGQEVARQVVGVGALQPSEARTFTLAVELYKPGELRDAKPAAQPVAPRATIAASAAASAPSASTPRAPTPSSPSQGVTARGLAPPVPGGPKPGAFGSRSPDPPKWPMEPSKPSGDTKPVPRTPPAAGQSSNGVASPASRGAAHKDPRSAASAQGLQPKRP